MPILEYSELTQIVRYVPWSAGRERVYTGSGSQSQAQSQARSEYIPGAGANHRQGASIYQERVPIAGRESVHTGTGSQSQVGRGYIPGAGANRRQGE
eukprot:1873193-Pyramimonas_sp.AAC.1